VSVFEYQTAFMAALREGRHMQQRIFDTIEQRFADDLGSGQAGVKLYEDLISAVRGAGVPGAEEEFEKRFSALLNPERAPSRLVFGPPEEAVDAAMALAPDRPPGGNWGWISALGAAAGIVALVLGFNSFKMSAAEPPTAAESRLPAVEATEPQAETTTTEPASTAATNAQIPAAADATDAASEPASVLAPAASDR
jgi:hypothetical protein